MMEIPGEVVREVERLRAEVESSAKERQDDRIRKIEEYAEMRMVANSLEGRVRILEEGVTRMMTHSTWLLRLLVGGVVVALLNFMMEGGLINVPH